MGVGVVGSDLAVSGLPPPFSESQLAQNTTSDVMSNTAALELLNRFFMIHAPLPAISNGVLRNDANRAGPSFAGQVRCQTKQIIELERVGKLDGFRTAVRMFEIEEPDVS